MFMKNKISVIVKNFNEVVEEIIRRAIFGNSKPRILLNKNLCKYVYFFIFYPPKMVWLPLWPV
jgi:hypothetical protein